MFYFVWGGTTRTGDFKCREVKTGFCRNRSMQTGSSETLIGWKSGQTTFVPLLDQMEGAWLRGDTTWTGDFKCREVKTGFCRNRSMQTGSSGTLIGWKSGQTTFVPLWYQMEGAWLWTRDSVCCQRKRNRQPTLFIRLLPRQLIYTQNQKYLVWKTCIAAFASLLLFDLQDKMSYNEIGKIDSVFWSI
jgi:hypothetical protein